MILFQNRSSKAPLCRLRKDAGVPLLRRVHEADRMAGDPEGAEGGQGVRLQAQAPRQCHQGLGSLREGRIRGDGGPSPPRYLKQLLVVICT